MPHTAASQPANRASTVVPTAGPRGLVAHAAWLTQGIPWRGALALWAEAQQPAARRGSLAILDAVPTTVRNHSFCAKPLELHALLEGLWHLSRPTTAPRTSRAQVRLPVWLPSLATRAWPSPDLVGAGWAADPLPPGAVAGDVPLAPWRVNAVLLDAEATINLLAGLSSAPGEAPVELPAWSPFRPPIPAVLGEDLRFWVRAARFVLSLLVRQRYVPGASLAPLFDAFGRWRGPQVVSTWEPALTDPTDRARFNALVAAMPDVCRAAGPPASAEVRREQIPGRRRLLEGFLGITLRACVTQWARRSGAAIHLPGSARQDRSSHAYYYGSSYGYQEYNHAPGTSVTARWVTSLPTPGGEFYLAPDEVRPFLDGMRRWHERLPGMRAGSVRLCFRLIAPGATADEPEVADPLPAPPAAIEHNAHEHASDRTSSACDDAGAAMQGLDEAGRWQLEFLLQARDDPSLLVPLAQVWSGEGDAARALDRVLEHGSEAPREAVPVWLEHAAQYFPPIAASLQLAEPAGCELSGEEAYTFLVEAAPLLADADFGVLLPPWWKRVRVRPKLSLQVTDAMREGSGLLGLDAVLSYDWRVALGGEALSREELERLVQLKEPLVRLRGRWVELQRDEVEAMVAFVRKHSSGRISLGEALRAALTGQVGDGLLPVEEVRADAWIGDLLGRLRAGETFAEVAPPEGLQGTLRPYQVRGLGWLSFLSRYGLGACLADDMGLGKSVQLLSLLQDRKNRGQLTKPILLVCPTSVVGNWRHESARFTPTLRVLIHHGSERSGRTDVERFKSEIADHDLVVTTYGLLPRDEDALAAIEWGGVVFDEAQNIKNPETRQSRVARGLRAPVRVALTGTPVENRLAELWSLMDFLNPGYLGSARHFQQALGQAIERLRDPTATTQLQALVRPFILRRVKTDPNVIRDLPEKLEIKEYCPLTREQVTLYEAVVRDGLRRLEEAATPMQRRGVVLSVLTRLKQVCNHPAHLLDDGSPFPGRSGKLMRLEELIEELMAEGDRALIFTQFTALADRLRPHLAERFGAEVLYLHGGVPRTQREQMIARFQSDDGPPLFLLSLRAGGLGLNLTKANHVIHFDRWWNPAVENQATDRAYRIGQVRNVQVRKLICSGTLEERIDQLLEQKQGLAEHVIGSGEGWLTELSTEQLRDLFALRADALAD